MASFTSFVSSLAQSLIFGRSSQNDARFGIQDSQLRVRVAHSWLMV
jgi:hypothetical protein